MASYDFSGKTALVTGGSRGIGRAIALELASCGADVIINFWRRRSAAREVVRLIEGMGCRAAAIPADIGEPEAHEALFQRVRDEWGSIDFYINNAASAFMKPLLDLQPFHWDYILKTNLFATVNGCREAVSLMPDKRGVIVMLSSMGSRSYVDMYGGMGAMKAAIESIARTLTIELAPRVNVNTVLGGLIETDSTRSFKDFERLKDACEAGPMKRVGEPEDIAKVVAFLCSDDAAWIRGQTIIADGGQSLTT